MLATSCLDDVHKKIRDYTPGTFRPALVFTIPNFALKEAIARVRDNPAEMESAKENLFNAHVNYVNSTCATHFRIRHEAGLLNITMGIDIRGNEWGALNYPTLNERMMDGTPAKKFLVDSINEHSIGLGRVAYHLFIRPLRKLHRPSRITLGVQELARPIKLAEMEHLSRRPELPLNERTAHVLGKYPHLNLETKL